VLWRSLAATSGVVLVFIDSDLIDFDAGFVPALLGPVLLRRRSKRVALVKGFYRRPLRVESAEVGTGGGRVTELLARPLLNALRPELAGVVQPLGGEYAATREFLESVPFAAGYGVEIGLLLDAHTRYGLDGLTQVNLGVRKHRNRSLLELGVMSRQILGAALPRCGVAEVAGSAGITQFVQLGARFLPTESEVLVADRPPMRDVLATRSA
jgi:glucosyl-3-phosphoglycerate synthase